MNSSKKIINLKRQIQRRLKQLSKINPMIDGSLCQIERKCGKANCRCTRGEKHIGYILTKKISGKTKSIYIPNQMVDEVKTWIAERKRIKKLMKEISGRNEKIIRLYTSGKQEKANKDSGKTKL